MIVDRLPARFARLDVSTRSIRAAYAFAIQGVVGLAIMLATANPASADTSSESVASITGSGGQAMRSITGSGGQAMRSITGSGGQAMRGITGSGGQAMRGITGSGGQAMRGITGSGGQAMRGITGSGGQAMRGITGSGGQAMRGISGGGSLGVAPLSGVQVVGTVLVVDQTLGLANVDGQDVFVGSAYATDDLTVGMVVFVSGVSSVDGSLVLADDVTVLGAVDVAEISDRH